MPYSQTLFEVAKRLLLAVCYKMVLKSSDEQYIMEPKSQNAKTLFAKLVAGQIIKEFKNGMNLSDKWS